jgi:hypothetical protein
MIRGDRPQPLRSRSHQKEVDRRKVKQGEVLLNLDGHLKQMPHHDAPFVARRRARYCALQR